MTMYLQIKDIAFGYDGSRVLDGVTLEVERGTFLGVLGPNGSGKTTLLRCITQYLKPETGTVHIDGRDASGMKRRDIAQMVGVVPQYAAPEFSFTVLEIVLMGRSPYTGRFARESKEDLDSVKSAMEICGVSHLAQRMVNELSGGQHQRVLLARTLAQKPTVLLLDEPTRNLDANHRLEILQLLKHLTVTRGYVTLLVSHDLNLAARFCDRLVILREGRVFAAGALEEVLTAKTIEEVFQVEAAVTRNPDSGITNVTVQKPCEVDSGN